MDLGQYNSLEEYCDPHTHRYVGQRYKHLTVPGCVHSTIAIPYEMRQILSHKEGPVYYPSAGRPSNNTDRFNCF